MKQTVKKTDNIGTTFVGLVMTAFHIDDQRKIRNIVCYSNCGMVTVEGIDYDYFDNGSTVTFVESK